MNTTNIVNGAGSMLLETIYAIVATALTSFILSLYIEYKWNISEKIIRLKHYRSELSLKPIVSYNSDIPFNDLKDIVLNSLSNTDCKFRTYKDTEYQLDVIVNDSFHVTVDTASEDTFTIQMSKRKSTMKTKDSDVNSIIEYLDNFQRDISLNGWRINVNSYTFYLYFSFENAYFKFHAPKNVDVNSYELSMIHAPSTSKIILKRDYLKITSVQKNDVLSVVKSFK
ncbi:hypothetical protein V7O61_03055 [Methanolobus sp. WCC1]|uniref:hypothetical protein n=1 Tax=unclassified Methanolobus TaxID=2629569 RepID=UPI00325166F6